MKLKLILALALVALAGLASALVLAGPTQAGDGKHVTTGTTTTGTTTTGKHHDGDAHHAKSSCQIVSLRGSDASGSLAFTVTKANHNGSSLVGKPVTLTVPAGSALNATACVDAAGVLTLRGLEVRAPHAAPTTTTTTAAVTTTGTTNNMLRFHSHKHGFHK